MKQGASQRGFTLIELMIGLLLGLLVAAAASAIFLANSRTREATDSLSRVQEGARVAFELIARDVRQAGGHSCGSAEMPIANSLANRDTVWWSTWGTGLIGYGPATASPGLAFGTGAGQRLNGTSAIEIKYASSRDFDSAAQTGTPAQFVLNVPSAVHGLPPVDIVTICSPIGPSGANPGQQGGPLMTIAQVSVPANSSTLTYATATPGNCANNPRFSSVACNATSGAAYVFPAGSRVARYNAVRWYIANNGRGGRSLYRSTITRVNNPTVVNEEMIEGVTDLNITYIQEGATAYVPAASVTN